LKSAKATMMRSAATPSRDLNSPRALPVLPWQLAQVAARLRASAASCASADKGVNEQARKMVDVQALTASSPA
jgi:hypothetical protein